MQHPHGPRPSHGPRDYSSRHNTPCESICMCCYSTNVVKFSQKWPIDMKRDLQKRRVYETSIYKCMRPKSWTCGVWMDVSYTRLFCHIYRSLFRYHWCMRRKSWTCGVFNDTWKETYKCEKRQTNVEKDLEIWKETYTGEWCIQHESWANNTYGVATTSRLLKIIRHSCKRAL